MRWQSSGSCCSCFKTFFAPFEKFEEFWNRIGIVSSMASGCSLSGMFVDQRLFLSTALWLSLDRIVSTYPLCVRINAFLTLFAAPLHICHAEFETYQLGSYPA